MAASGGSAPSDETATETARWPAFRLTARLRRQMVQALVVCGAFILLTGGLTLAFGIGILQYTLAGFVVGTIVVVAAMGLTLIYGIRGFANFAYGDLMTLGAYVALATMVLGGLDFLWAAIVAFVVLGLVGIILEILIFTRLEGRGAVAPLVASVGVGLVIQNGIRAIATTRQWNFPVTAVDDIPIVPGLGIHPVRGIATLVVGLTFMVSAHVMLKYTNLGKAMRATADNLELATATGIDTKRVRYAAWSVSCAFGSGAGVLLGLGTVISPSMGFDVLLLIFAAVILGGIGSPYGAMLGGITVGLSQEMVVPLLIWLGRPDVIGLEHATAYKIAVPFLILIAVLLLRPWGIAGRRPAFSPRSFFGERLSRVLAGRPASARQPGGNGREGG